MACKSAWEGVSHSPLPLPPRKIEDCAMHGSSTIFLWILTKIQPAYKKSHAFLRQGRNTLDFDFTALTHLYFSVTLYMYILAQPRTC